MKKSRSSVPRFAERCPDEPPPVLRKEGLFATGGRPELEPPPPLVAFVAMAVGNTNEGESFPAKPMPHVSEPSTLVVAFVVLSHQSSNIRCRYRKPILATFRPLPQAIGCCILVHDNGRRLRGHGDTWCAFPANAFKKQADRRGSDCPGSQSRQLPGELFEAA